MARSETIPVRLCDLGACVGDETGCNSTDCLRPRWYRWSMQHFRKVFDRTPHQQHEPLIYKKHQSYTRVPRWTFRLNKATGTWHTTETYTGGLVRTRKPFITACGLYLNWDCQSTYDQNVEGRKDCQTCDTIATSREWSLAWQICAQFKAGMTHGNLAQKYRQPMSWVDKMIRNGIILKNMGA